MLSSSEPKKAASTVHSQRVNRGKTSSKESSDT